MTIVGKKQTEETVDNLLRLAWFGAVNIYQFAWHSIATLAAPRRRMNITAHGVSNWSRKLAYMLNIEVVRESEIPKKPGLIISNHTSYHDIPAIGVLMPTIFISKKSVQYIPIAGQAALAVGIIFIDRKSAASRLEAVKKIEKRLSQGLFVVNFSEGTTTPANELREFKPGLFKLLLGNDKIPVYPLRLKYENPEVQWLGGKPMYAHYKDTQALDKITVKAKFMPPVFGSDFSTADDFKQAVHSAIKADL